MIGLDTNVLVRYLTQDEPIQAAKAGAILEGLTERNSGFVSIVVLAETAWVLERTYQYSDAAIATALTGLLGATALVVQEEAAVIVALRAAKDGNGTFADALIGALSSSAGCERTVTFDKRALRLPGFELI